MTSIAAQNAVIVIQREVNVPTIAVKWLKMATMLASIAVKAAIKKENAQNAVKK